MALRKLKHLWVNGLRKARDGYADTREDLTHSSVKWRLLLGFIVLYLVVTLIAGIYWSMSPGLFNVHEQAARVLADRQLEPAAGATTTVTLITGNGFLYFPCKCGNYRHAQIVSPRLIKNGNHTVFDAEVKTKLSRDNLRRKIDSAVSCW